MAHIPCTLHLQQALAFAFMCLLINLQLSSASCLGFTPVRWQWTPGGVAFEASDQGVLNGTFKANASLWNVRPSVKYEWRVDERQCGKGQIRRFDGRAMATALLREIGSPPAPALASASPGQGPSPGTLQTSRRLLAASSRALSPAKNSSSTSNAGSHEKQGALGPQRVLVLVGDSMQHAFAQSLLDNMRMGRPKAETTILANDSLPCAVKKLSHKKVRRPPHCTACCHGCTVSGCQVAARGLPEHLSQLCPGIPRQRN